MTAPGTCDQASVRPPYDACCGARQDMLCLLALALRPLRQLRARL
jgi:hypothetical protein